MNQTPVIPEPPHSPPIIPAELADLIEPMPEVLGVIHHSKHTASNNHGKGEDKKRRRAAKYSRRMNQK